jgi:membrane associated rhomboid family serine protease
MALIIWYLGLVMAGDLLAYFIGLVVERQWGGWASMVVFLAFYFVSLWAAWVFSVWITEPKKTAALAGTLPNQT